MTRILLAFAWVACALPGQVIFQNRSMNTDANGDMHVVFSTAHVVPGQVVTGAPYSADQVFEHHQTLSDGTHITQPGNRTEHIARDNQGRVRIERSLMAGPAADKMPMVVEISDPVAGVAYILDEQNRVAHRVTMEVRPRNAQPPQGGGAGSGTGGTVAIGSTGVTATASVIHPSQSQNTREQLGTQSIEGVVAEGVRTTTTWPAGARGNDRPFTEIRENWYSKELKVTVLSKNSSPLNGDGENKLINISRAEPDASLFQPPSDYTVVDDKDSVTLDLKRQ